MDLLEKSNSSYIGLLTAYKMYKKLKAEHPRSKITLKEVKEYLEKDPVLQQTRRPPKAKNLKIIAPPNSFQLDIMFLNDYTFRTYDKILVFIEITSRKAFLYPMKTKKNEEKIEIIKTFIKDIEEPIYLLEGDNEWNNKEITDLLEKHNIKYSFIVANDEHLTKNGNKLGIIDRFVRTIRSLILKYILKNDTLDWVSPLQDIVEVYNTTPHHSLDLKTPNDIYKDEKFQRKLFNDGMKHNLQVEKVQNLNIGDLVRAIKPRGKMEKEKEYFTKKIYTIVEKEGHRYKIADENNHIIQRVYKFGELLKVNGILENIPKAFETNENVNENVEKKDIQEEILQNKKQRKKEREYKKLDINAENIIDEPRTRKRNSKYF